MSHSCEYGAACSCEAGSSSSSPAPALATASERLLAALIVSRLELWVLDESAPSGACTTELEIARDLGYRAGYNSAIRAVIRELAR